MFLTRSELIELTGYRRPSCMIQQLQSYGLRFFVAADGYPRVARSEVEGNPRKVPKSKPNFAALGRSSNGP
jgi:hypothetical protein